MMNADLASRPASRPASPSASSDSSQAGRIAGALLNLGSDRLAVSTTSEGRIVLEYPKERLMVTCDSEIVRADLPARPLSSNLFPNTVLHQPADSVTDRVNSRLSNLLGDLVYAIQCLCCCDHQFVDMPAGALSRQVTRHPNGDVTVSQTDEFGLKVEIRVPAGLAIDRFAAVEQSVVPTPVIMQQ